MGKRARGLTGAQFAMLDQAVKHDDGLVGAGRFQGPIAQTLVKRGLLEDRRYRAAGLGYRVTEAGRDAHFEALAKGREDG